MSKICSRLARRIIRNWRAWRMIRNTHRRNSKTDPLIGVVGPQWLKTMVYSVTREPKRGQIPKVVIVGPISDNDSGSQVKVLLDEKKWTQVPTIGYRVALPKSLSAEPIVATRLTNPVSRLIPRGCLRTSSCWRQPPVGRLFFLKQIRLENGSSQQKESTSSVVWR